MTVKVELASDRDATTWEDITDEIYLETARWAGTASHGEIDTGSGFDWRDDAGTRVIPWRRRVRVTETATTPDTIIWQGRTVGDEIHRGAIKTEDAKQFDVNLVDVNADFGGMPFAGTQRPEEDDTDRIQYLLDTHMQGQNRPSTNIGDTYFSTANPYILPAHLYEGVQLIDWFTHIVDITGREFFLTREYDLFYDTVESTAYAAGISITDDTPNYVNSFPPILPEATEDATEMFTGVRFRWAGGTVNISRSAVETANDQWRTVVVDQSVTTLARATAKANVFLNQFDHSRTSFRCAVEIPATKVDLLSWGMTISFRSAACGVLTPTTYRVTRLSWQLIGEGLWRADMEINYATKFRRASNPGVPPVVAPVPFVPPSGGGGTFIQSNIACAGTGALTVSLPNPPTPGNLVMCWFWSRASATLASQAPPEFNQDAVFNTSPFWAFVGSYYAQSGDSGSYTTTNPGTLARIMCIAEFSDIARPDHISQADLGPFAYGGTTNVSPTGTGFVTGIFLANTDIAGRETHVVSPSTVIEQDWCECLVGNGPYGSIGYHAAAPLNAASGNNAFQDLGYIVCNHPPLADNEPAAPTQGQPVTETATGDGVTTAFATNYPYAPSSLQVWINGVDVTTSVTETDPTTGDFTFSSAPTNGAVITIRYLGAAP